MEKIRCRGLLPGVAGCVGLCVPALAVLPVPRLAQLGRAGIAPPEPRGFGDAPHPWEQPPGHINLHFQLLPNGPGAFQREPHHGPGFALAFICLSGYYH